MQHLQDEKNLRSMFSRCSPIHFTQVLVDQVKVNSRQLCPTFVNMLTHVQSFPFTELVQTLQILSHILSNYSQPSNFFLVVSNTQGLFLL